MTSMTGRERVLAALSHEETDRVPIDFGGSQSSTIYFTAYERLKAHLGLDHKTVVGRRRSRCAVIDESVLRRFDVDTRYLAPGAYEGVGNGRDIDADNFADELGAVWRKVGDGPYINVDGPFHGKDANLDDLENYNWPDPADPGYVRGLRAKAEALRESTDGAIVFNFPSGVVHTGQWLRGYESWLKDLHRNRDYLCRLTDLIADWAVGVIERTLDVVGDIVDVAQFGDDLGTQETTLFDPRFYRDLMKPRHRRMVAAIKERTDAKVLMHSCGSVSALFDDFIDIGIDAINPVQVGARHMEPDRLKAEFGDRLAFWGAIDTQRVLPYGTVDEVRAETRRIIDILGQGGGYILNSVHNIQPGVPPENVVAMFDEARTYRPHGQGLS